MEDFEFCPRTHVLIKNSGEKVSPGPGFVVTDPTTGLAYIDHKIIYFLVHISQPGSTAEGHLPGGLPRTWVSPVGSSPRQSGSSSLAAAFSAYSNDEQI